MGELAQEMPGAPLDKRRMVACYLPLRRGHVLRVSRRAHIVRY